MYLMMSLGSLATNMHQNGYLLIIYLYACLQKVGETEMNSTPLETLWFCHDETKIGSVCDLFVIGSNAVETEVL